MPYGITAPRFIGIASIVLLLLAAGSAQAWQESDSPLELPETRVEADPLAPQGPTTPLDPDARFPPPNYYPPQNYPQTDPFESVLNGTIFDSPPAEGYVAESSTTGSLINVPDLQLPATVNTVTRSALADQQILNLRDAVRNIPGAVPVGNGQFADRLFIRGFELRTRDFRKNGFLDPTFTPRDFQNIERIEVLKGPASVLYGSAAPSGTVNFITKKPIDAQFSRFDVQIGSWGLDRYTLDTNGYVTSDGSVLYRVNGAYENTESFRDFDFTERHLIAPSVRWIISDDTRITWEAEFIENRRRGDRGLPAVGGDALALPRDRYIGEPANDFMYTEDRRTSLVLEHRFDNEWTLYAGASTVFYEFPGSHTYATAPPTGAPPAPPGQFYRNRSDFVDQENASSLIVNLAGDVETGPFRHRLLFGTEHIYYDSDSTFNTSAFATPFDVTNPAYVNPPATPTFLSDFPVFRQVRHGYYLQDYIELSPYWQVLGGVRFDELHLDSVRTATAVTPLGPFPIINADTEQRFERTTPRAGVVFQPIPEVLTTYFNYSRSFNPPGGGAYLFTVDEVRPELGESYEVGVKTWLTENAMFHVAWFHATRENTPFTTFGLAGPMLIQIGEERSQGVEIELVGQLTDRWNVIANYAYVHTKLTDPNNPDIFGQRQRNVPENQVNLWSRYDLIANDTHTFGAALGMMYYDDRSANLTDTVTLPSFVRWDGGLYYRRGRLDALVYLENLFDEDYAISSIDEFQIFRGAPFNARAQVGLTF